MKKIFTIGYTAFDLDTFISVLKSFNINVLIDVRTTPFSQYYVDFNNDNLSKKLKDNNIIYRHYPNEFGARQTNTDFYSDGIVDFSKFTKSKQFLDGVKKIDDGIKLGYCFCLMCAEKDPINCHRASMLGKGFKDNGYMVEHILADKTIQNQEILESRLLDNYFPDRYQIKIGETLKSDNDLIIECYKLKNMDIGYRSEEREELE